MLPRFAPNLRISQNLVCSFWLCGSRLGLSTICSAAFGVFFEQLLINFRYKKQLLIVFWANFEQLFKKLRKTFWKISSNLWKILVSFCYTLIHRLVPSPPWSEISSFSDLLADVCTYWDYVLPEQEVLSAWRLNPSSHAHWNEPWLFSQIWLQLLRAAELHSSRSVSQAKKKKRVRMGKTFFLAVIKGNNAPRRFSFNVNRERRYPNFERKPFVTLWGRRVEERKD